MSAGLPLNRPEFAFERLEEGLAGACDSAANDDGFRIEHVDIGRDRAGKSFDGPHPYFTRGRISTIKGFDQGVRRGESVVGACLDIPIANEIFNAAGDARYILGRLHVQTVVAEMARATDGALKQVAIDNGSAADTRA